MNLYLVSIQITGRVQESYFSIKTAYYNTSNRFSGVLLVYVEAAGHIGNITKQ
jgi:hypothetical protein